MSETKQQKVIARVGLMRRVVRLWEAEVNGQLSSGSGWRLVTCDVQKRGLRIICLAVLEREIPACCKK